MALLRGELDLRQDGAQCREHLAVGTTLIGPVDQLVTMVHMIHIQCVAEFYCCFLKHELQNATHF